jgi:hypothetical protein
MTELLVKSFFIGFIGDALLQIITAQKGNFAGLRDFYARHGIFESLCIASSIMFLSTWCYLKLGLPITYPFLFLYGGMLDVLFRQCNLMPTLQNTYYSALPWWLSFLWGGIPMMMVLYAVNIRMPLLYS